MPSKKEALEAICRCTTGLQALCDLIADGGDGQLTTEDMRDIADAARLVRRTLRPFYEVTRRHQGVKVYRI